MAGDAKATKVEVFVSFANGDKKSLRHRDVWKRLANCLDALQVEGVIREWRSQAIDAENPDAAAIGALKRADIVIFALGQNYLDHPERHREILKNLPGSGRYLVFSLLLYQGLWRNTPFEKFNLLPSNKTPAIEWDDVEDVFMEIKDAIRQARRAIYPDQPKPRLVKKDPPEREPSPLPEAPAFPTTAILPPDDFEAPYPVPAAPCPQTWSDSGSEPPESFDIFANIVEEDGLKTETPSRPDAPQAKPLPPAPPLAPAPAAPTPSAPHSPSTGDRSLPSPIATTGEPPGLPRPKRPGKPRRTVEIDSSPALSAPELELERTRIVTDAARSPDFQRAEKAQVDIVDCTVFAPPAAPRNSVIFVQVYAHLQEQAEEVIRMAGEFDSEAKRRAVKSLEEPVARGTKLSFELAMPGARVTDPAQSIVWRGKPDAAQFAVEIPGDCPIGNLVGSVTVSAQSIPFGHIKFKLQVTGPGSESPMNEATGDEAKRYSMAFVSYASPDRNKVLARVQMLNLMGIRYFQDVLSLDPGDRWEKEIYRNIDSCDLFLLFWSKAARDSEWVLKEIRYARDRRPPPEIKPVILEGPPVIAPPEDLNDLHFNDKFIYFITDQKS
jgi:hypothetical protein